MAEIIAFPGSNDREWRGIESTFRAMYSEWPNAEPALDECLPIVREKMKVLFEEFSISPTYQIPGPITDAQISAIKDAVNQGVNLVVVQLQKERAAALVEIFSAEFRSAYYRLNGPVA
jgi:hypothetical protein